MPARLGIMAVLTAGELIMNPRIWEESAGASNTCSPSAHTLPPSGADVCTCTGVIKSEL